jgi:hypothetical protein
VLEPKIAMSSPKRVRTEDGSSERDPADVPIEVRSDEDSDLATQPLPGGEEEFADEMAAHLYQIESVMTIVASWKLIVEPCRYTNELLADIENFEVELVLLLTNIETSLTPKQPEDTFSFSSSMAHQAMDSINSKFGELKRVVDNIKVRSDGKHLKRNASDP